ncbi:MAG: glycosyltransferase family 2 protein [Tepidisphaeraceae bacterium]
MRLLIVIVNFRSAQLAIDCLKSIEPQVRAIAGGCRVCLVDGASGDDSVPVLQRAIEQNGWANWCDLRPLAVNGGFAYGNNEGIRPYLESSDRPDFVLLLNPDTVALPGSIGTLLDYAIAHPEYGICGSRTQYPDGSPQTSAFRFPSISGEVEGSLRFGPVTKMLANSVVAPPPADHEVDADWVVGASMIVRREVFEKIGLLDDRYFMYYEEVDFCLRQASRLPLPVRAAVEDRAPDRTVVGRDR